MRSFESQTDLDLADLVFGTNNSFAEIATDLGVSEVWVRKRIKELGLGWVRKNKGAASRGQAALTAIMRKLLPGENILTEYPVGEGLRLDVYCPNYKLAAEFHGRQHFEFNIHFHENGWDFEQAQKRDIRKAQLCEDLGISLVVFRYNDELTEETVFNRLLDAIEHGPAIVEEEKPSKFKGNAYYEAAKQRQREYRKQAYRRMKRTNGGKH